MSHAAERTPEQTQGDETGGHPLQVTEQTVAEKKKKQSGQLLVLSDSPAKHFRLRRPRAIGLLPVPVHASEAFTVLGLPS